MRAAPVGELKSRIQFERPTASRTTVGTKKSTWASLGYARARVLYGTGAERREAGVEKASQAATFRCRKGPVTELVAATDRIVHAGLNWDIVAVSVFQTSPVDIEFTAVASRG